MICHRWHSAVFPGKDSWHKARPRVFGGLGRLPSQFEFPGKRTCVPTVTGLDLPGRAKRTSAKTLVLLWDQDRDRVSLKSDLLAKRKIKRRSDPSGIFGSLWLTCSK